MSRAVELYVVDYLEQTERWITGDGRDLRIDEMDPDHLRFALRFLRRYAASLHYDVETRLLLAPEASTLRERAEQDAQLRHHQSIAPDVWIDDTPLARRLQQLVPRDEPPRRRHRLLPRRWWR